MPYDWGQLPKSLSLSWMPYRGMFDEFSREIANSLNQLTDYTRRLKIWDRTLATLADEERMDAVHEFIEPLATVGLTLPYVIRSRFIFSITHLCHQANRSREGITWRDDLGLDTEIEFKDADKYGSKWRQYSRLKRRVERIGDRRHQNATHDFRNAYSHRFSPGIVIGITQIIKRRVSTPTKAVTYAFGGVPPLSLEMIAKLLSDQCTRGYAAFDAFQELIREHEKSITEYQLRRDPPPGSATALRQ